MGQALNFLKHKEGEAESLARLDATLKRYHSFYKNEIDPGIERITKVSELIGSPQNKLPNPIHIAGTNGKGSTLAFLHAILEGENQRVHKMSSPHLISFHERIYLAGEYIETEELIDLLEGLEPVYQENEISFFEAVTAATFKKFNEYTADYCLIETGMGGRFDATNIIEKPAMTLITTISRDHENFLGSDISKIAWEKAGIMKAGVPCIVGPQIFPEVLDVIREEAARIGAPLYCAGQDWFIEKDQNDEAVLMLEVRHGWPIEESVHILPQLPLMGHHQYGNVGVALIAAKILLGQARQEFVGVSDLTSHLAKTKWPARMQNLAQHPYKKMVRAQDHVWLDGAHNDSAALAVAAQIRNWRQMDENCEVYLITGLINTKSPDALFKPLSDLIDGVATVPVPTSWRSYTAQELHDILDEYLGDDAKQKLVGAFDNAGDAITHIAQNIDVEEQVTRHYLICGSLYLAGSVLGEDENAKNYFS